MRIASKIDSPFFNMFRVKVISPSNPMARAAIEARGRFPAGMAARLGGGVFGDVHAADVYIYPALDHAATP